MSNWTYISGVVEVSPRGRTKAEKRYILETILAHLPKVTGSDENMESYIIQKDGYDEIHSCDAFGQWIMLPNNKYGIFVLESDYLIVVSGKLRGRVLDETKREFTKWLCRLAKRIPISEISVDIRDDFDRHFTLNNYVPWYDMNEFIYDWCEFLMWDQAESGLPKKLEKYYEINNEKYRT